MRSLEGTLKPAAWRTAIHQLSKLSWVNRGSRIVESQAQPKLWAESPGRFAGKRDSPASNLWRSSNCSVQLRKPDVTSGRIPNLPAHRRANSARSRTGGARPRSWMLTYRAMPTTRTLNTASKISFVPTPLTRIDSPGSRTAFTRYCLAVPPRTIPLQMSGPVNVP